MTKTQVMQRSGSMAVPRLQGNKPPCRSVVVVRAAAPLDVPVTTGVVFMPLSAAKEQLQTVERINTQVQSLARTNYHPECEAAINEQINIEYNISYVYHSLFAFFDRDNIGLPGFAKYFKDGSDEERGHAELLMRYQNKRGGKVQLKTIVMPDVDVNNAEKGEALYAMELALSLEKLNFQKLRELHEVADKCGDAPMADFIEGELLAEQVDAVKQVSEMVSALRRIGKGLGVWQFDKTLQ
eukprot:CAMPEP_0119109564 /NCGR_PEP_ID=MMETSP1180-20130426/20553_1 /TAXON_ID=3052 ORGANISM="Chlamydomonas cf sp, Strain CCMP681" /NCGR_SAMPLE_ID=MMETSP1180 /ASSEMBLY_ACC=CAM_ASM_000741 /LENGTH=239 /DNA_ID=CAMNT_0007095395 /DNA_START=30 /DNA_END=749 /DNA_ORIENTATION=-